MEKSNKNLTPEEFRTKACARSAQDKRLFYTDVRSYMLGFLNGYDFQLAIQKEELEAANRTIEELREESADLLSRAKVAEGQLAEAVKLLKKWQAEMEYPQGSMHSVRVSTDSLLSRLSSGDTKPASEQTEANFTLIYKDTGTGDEMTIGPYSVKDLLFGDQEELFLKATECACKPVGESLYTECNCDSKYDHFIFDRIVPAPPESLTDKK